MYASVFIIPMRVMMWSAGIACFTESPDMKSVVKKLVFHPCIVAVYIGLGLMIFQNPLNQIYSAVLGCGIPLPPEREAICPKNLSKFWKINLKAFSHKSGKLCYNHNYGRGRGCAALTENNEEGGEPYGTVPLQALCCDQKRR